MVTVFLTRLRTQRKSLQSCWCLLWFVQHVAAMPALILQRIAAASTCLQNAQAEDNLLYAHIPMSNLLRHSQDCLQVSAYD